MSLDLDGPGGDVDWGVLAGLDELIAEPPLGPAGEDLAAVAMAAAVGDSYRSTRRRMHRALSSPPGADRDWNAISLPFVVGPGGRIGKARP